MDAEKHTGLWQYSTEIIKVFFWNYSDKLDLFWTRVGQGFLGGCSSGIETTSPSSLTLVSLLELARE